MYSGRSSQHIEAHGRPSQASRFQYIGRNGFRPAWSDASTDLLAPTGQLPYCTALYILMCTASYVAVTCIHSYERLDVHVHCLHYLPAILTPLYLICPMIKVHWLQRAAHFQYSFTEYIQQIFRSAVDETSQINNDVADAIRTLYTIYSSHLSIQNVTGNGYEALGAFRSRLIGTGLLNEFQLQNLNTILR